jgi:hypothetical protein
MKGHCAEPLLHLNPRRDFADSCTVGSISTEVVLWILMPAVAAAGSASLVWLLMSARIQVLTANYRTALARMEGLDRQPGTEEFLSNLRVERRRFVRRLSGAHGSTNSVITQERLYFRNIPLTGWMEDEVALGEGELTATETSLVPAIANGAIHSVSLSDAFS